MTASQPRSNIASDRPWVLSPRAIVAAPALAVVASCADVVVLLWHQDRFGDRSTGFGLVMTVVITIPLSIVTGAWTLFMLLRLRREVLRRDEAEVGLRTALDQRERALERELAVRRELDHRVRNNLAGLIGLIGIYERSGRSPLQLGQAIRSKIEAMRGVHDIAGRAGGGPVDLHSLLALVAESIVPVPVRAGLVMGGPPTAISTGQAGAMAMILQELCTNSLKHGALSAGGRVMASWSLKHGNEGDALTLRWNEKGVPAASKPGAQGSGVGLGLIEGFARSDLRGECLMSRDEGSWSVELHALLARPSDTERGGASPAAVLEEICA